MNKDKIIEISRLFLFILFSLSLFLNIIVFGRLIVFPENATKKMEVNKTNNTKYIVTL
jgi:hypothetical protein